MASTATVTGKVGPDSTLTAQVFNNVTFFSVDTPNQVLFLKYDNGDGAREIHIDISSAVTITLTVSGGAYTLTIADS